jgi:hypothetical protein
LACAVNVNIVGENTDTIRKNTEALLESGKEVGLEVNPERTKNICDTIPEGRTKHSMEITNRPFEDVAKFKYLGPTLTRQDWMHEEIKSRISWDNACICFVWV